MDTLRVGVSKGERSKRVVTFVAVPGQRVRESLCLRKAVKEAPMEMEQSMGEEQWQLRTVKELSQSQR